MDRQSGCPKHGDSQIKRKLNDYFCTHDTPDGICGYKLNKVEIANYTQIKSEESMKKLAEIKEDDVLYDNKATLEGDITLPVFKKNIEIKSWYVVDQFLEKKMDVDRAKVAILALGLLIKEKTLPKV